MQLYYLMIEALSDRIFKNKLQDFIREKLIS